VSCRIRVPQRVVEDVGVAVEGLGVARLRHHRIRAEEAAQQRVIEPRPVVIQPYCTLFKLACKAAAGGGGAAAVAGLTVGFVAQLGHLAAAAVDREGGGTQVVREQVVQGAALAHGHPLAAEVIVFGDGAGLGRGSRGAEERRSEGACRRGQAGGKRGVWNTKAPKGRERR